MSVVVKQGAMFDGRNCLGCDAVRDTDPVCMTVGRPGARRAG